MCRVYLWNAWQVKDRGVLNVCINTRPNTSLPCAFFDCRTTCAKNRKFVAGNNAVATSDDTQCVPWGGACLNGNMPAASVRTQENECESCTTDHWLTSTNPKTCEECVNAKCIPGLYRTGTCDVSTGQGYTCQACAQHPNHRYGGIKKMLVCLPAV